MAEPALPGGSGAEPSPPAPASQESESALNQWLAQARSNARTTPLEARLTRSAAAPTSANTPLPVTLGNPSIAPPQWDGTVVLALPAPTR